MKRQKIKLSLPAIKKFREAIESGKLGGWLIESGEKANAGSVMVRYRLKNLPWVVSIKAERIYDNRH